MPRRRAKKVAYYYLRKPSRNNRLRTISISKQTEKNGKRVFEKFEEPRLATINARLLAHEISLIKAIELAQEIVAQLNADAPLAVEKEEVVIHNADNLKIYEAIWAKDYKFRDIVSARARMSEFANLFSLLGTRSIHTIRWEELQDLVNKTAGENPAKQRRLVGVANQIIKFLKDNSLGAQNLRPLKKKKLPRSTEVNHLTEEEFRKVLSHIRSRELRALYAMAFATGGRLGELLNITADKISKDKEGNTVVLIEGQIVRTEENVTSDSAPMRIKSVITVRDVLKNTNRKSNKNLTRKVGLLPLGEEYLKDWLAISHERRIEIRAANSYNKPLMAACRKLFPDNPIKHCTVHDLRHSYGIALLSEGFSIDDVAMSLGDSVAVVQQFYTGFVHSERSLENMLSKFAKLRAVNDKKGPGEKSEEKSESSAPSLTADDIQQLELLLKKMKQS